MHVRVRACVCLPDCVCVAVCVYSCTPTPFPASFLQPFCCLLDIQGNDGRVQLHEETHGATCASIATLSHVLQQPPVAADIIKADLAGLVLQIMQGPSSASFDAPAVNFLYAFSKQPTGRQQVLEELTPDTARSMIDLSLKYLEASEYDHSALVIASGDIACLLLCSCRILQSWATQNAFMSCPAADAIKPHVCQHIYCHDM